ncbi:MAG: hypothetical protein KF835_13010 [Xanthobacteraceae bacterium]|nr:hypothetical protein [Xanthobacteraceae bacterium]
MSALGVVAFFGLALTYRLCWARFHLVRDVMVPVVIALLCAAVAYYMYRLAVIAEPQVRERWTEWLAFGALASVGGPLAGALLALRARRRTTREPYSSGDGI